MTKIISNSVSFADSALTQAGTSGAQILSWSTTLQEYIPAARGTSRSGANTVNYWQNDIISTLVSGTRTYFRCNTNYVSSASFPQLSDYSNLDYLSQEAIPSVFPANSAIPQGFQLIQANSLWQHSSDRLVGASFDTAEQANWVQISVIRPQELLTWTASTAYNTGDTVAVSLLGIQFFIRKSGFATSGASFDLTEANGWRYVAQEKIVTFLPSTLIIANTIIMVDGTIWQNNSTRITGTSFDPSQWTRINTSIENGITNGAIAIWNSTTNSWQEGLISGLNISDNSIGFSDLVQLPANTLIGNSTGATANSSTITLGTNLNFSGSVLNTNILEINPTIFTANGPAIIKQINLVNTSAARAISAPTTTTVNSRFAVVDATGSASTNNITITFTGSSLYGVANDTFIINVNKASAEFIYSGPTIGWVRI